MSRATRSGGRRSRSRVARFTRSVSSFSKETRAAIFAIVSDCHATADSLGSSAMPLVRSGLDVLVAERAAFLRGRRIALVAHQASVDARLRHAAPLLAAMRGVTLAALWAPEHGLWGAPQDHAHIASTRDPITGLPVASLYGL